MFSVEQSQSRGHGRSRRGGSLVHDDSWQLRAACRGADMELFYSGEESDTRAALALCARCEVRDACLATAVARREAFGIWGGTTESHRRRIFRRDRRRQDSAA